MNSNGLPTPVSYAGKSPAHSTLLGSVASSPNGAGAMLSPTSATSTLDESLLSNCKVWVRLLGAEGQDQRIRAEKNINVTDLRKAMKTKVGVKVEELNLTVDEKPLLEAKDQPFLHHAPDAELVVHWVRHDRLKQLLEMRGLETINHRGKFERTALHFAVLDGELDLCRKIVDHKQRIKPLLDFRDVFHDTALMYGSILGYEEIVEMLIDRQAEVGCQNLCGRTALQLAAEHGHKKCVKALLQEKAKLGKAPPRLGPMGAMNISLSAPYLAELNERHQATHRIKVYKESRKAQPGLDF